MVIVEELTTRVRKDTIAKWYLEVFPKVATYVQKRGGDLETAKDLFQESIIITYEKLTLEGFRPSVSVEAYLTGIAKNKWLKYCAEQKRSESLDHVDMKDEKEQEPSKHKLLAILRSTGDKCLQILQAFYYEKLPMTQLSQRFGFKSERSATVQKFKCLEKVRDMVKQKSLSHEDFLD